MVKGDLLVLRLVVTTILRGNAGGYTGPVRVVYIDGGLGVMVAVNEGGDVGEFVELAVGDAEVQGGGKEVSGWWSEGGAAIAGLQNGTGLVGDAGCYG